MIPGIVVLLATLASATWIDVPFTRQEKNGCGSATAWMVMEYWGKSPPPPETIQQALYSEKAGGILASDLETYLSTQGFQTFSFSGGWNDLAENVAKGRPLIVSIEANSRGTPLHYVLVAGIDEPGQIVLVNDPAQRKLLPMSRSDFERRWEAMQFWTLLAVPKDSSSPSAPKRQAAIPSEVNDPSLEAATAAFRAGDLQRAKRLIHQTRHTATPTTEPLRNEFLATLYFLEGNLEASLKYWNRNGAPEVREVLMDFQTRWDPVRLDHTLGLSRASILKESDYRLALKRLDAAETMSRYTFDLTPVDDDAFDLSLRAAEKPRWSYIGMARGLPYQTVMPEWTNIGGRAINIDALWRWDNDRRRVRTEVSGPLSTSTRVKLAMDSKREVWNWQGVETAVRSDQLAARLDRVANSRWTWRTGAIVGRRPSGISLKYDGGTSYDLLRIPERRLVVGGELHAQLGRTFSSDERIGRAEAEMRLHWNPQPSGSDYAVLMRLRSGRIWGTAALDELFAVGVDRDDDLWLRGHAVVRDGRKGTGVVTRRYVLLNSEISKEFLDKSFVRAAIVPFVDIARAGSSFVDAGAELRVSIASLFTFSISLGRDLKAGRNVLFTNVGSSQTIH